MYSNVERGPGSPTTFEALEGKVEREDVVTHLVTEATSCLSPP